MRVTTARAVREVHFAAFAWFLAGVSRAASFAAADPESQAWADEDELAGENATTRFAAAVDDAWVIVTAVKNLACTGLLVCEGVCILRYCKLFREEDGMPSPRRVAVVLGTSVCLLAVGVASIYLGCAAVGAAISAAEVLLLMAFTDWVWIFGSFWCARGVLYILDHWDRRSAERALAFKEATVSEGDGRHVASRSEPGAKQQLQLLQQQQQQQQQLQVASYNLFTAHDSGVFSVKSPRHRDDAASHASYASSQYSAGDAAGVTKQREAPRSRLFLNPSRKRQAAAAGVPSLQREDEVVIMTQDNPLYAAPRTAGRGPKATLPRRLAQPHSCVGVVDIDLDSGGDVGPGVAPPEDEQWEKSISFFIETTKQFDQLMEQGFCLTEVALPREDEEDEDSLVISPHANVVLHVAEYKWDASSSRADLERISSALSLDVDEPEASGYTLSFARALLGLPLDAHATVVTACAQKAASFTGAGGGTKRKSPTATSTTLSATSVEWMIYKVHVLEIQA